MLRPLSPHAMTIMAIVSNVSELATKHHEYVMARDVMRALKKICADFGFNVSEAVFEHIIACIGDKPPQAMEYELGRLSTMIIGIDRKLDKKPLAGDKKYEQFR